MIAAILIGIVVLVVGGIALFLTMTAAGVLVGVTGAIIQGTQARHKANAEADEVAAKYGLSRAEAKEVRKRFRAREAVAQAQRARARAAARNNKWGNRK